MTDADAALLYSRVGRVYFDGTGDAAFEHDVGDDQSVQDEIPPAPRRRGRGRAEVE